MKYLLRSGYVGMGNGRLGAFASVIIHHGMAISLYYCWGSKFLRGR